MPSSLSAHWLNAVATSRRGGAGSVLDQYLSPHPGKRRTERFWLLYTPIWGGVSAIVMVGGLAERWGDLECLSFGLVLAAGALLGPILWRADEERGMALHRTAAFKMVLSVGGLAFGVNYALTPYFYDVLHMHYGFATQLTIRNVPVFLYLVTCAYFGTYCVLIGLCFRFVRAHVRPGLRWLGWVVAPMAVAFLETALNANPFMASLFCYDDLSLALWFGTLSYGLTFVVALPLWMAIDEEPGRVVPARHVGVWVLAALYAIVLASDALRYHVAPHVTTVVHGANGLGDVDTSCLEPIER